MQVAIIRDDVKPRYLEFLNEAIRDCCRIHSWDVMKTTKGVGVTGFNIDTAIGDPLFKEWQSGRYCVEDTDGHPLMVYNRMELEKFVPEFRPEHYVLFTQTGGTFFIALKGTEPVAGQTSTADPAMLTLHYFAYPASLLNPMQPDGVTPLPETTPMLDQYPDLVITRAISLVFKSINDPVWQMHDQAWQSLVNGLASENIFRLNPAARDDKP